MVYSLLPLVALLVTTEIAIRLTVGGPDPNELQPAAMRAGPTRYPAVYDRKLGYVPRASSVNPGLWGVTVTLREHGIRDNGNPLQPGPPILAVGDSFTFGDEVADHESWPSALERRLERQVLNAGVFGYGLDQAVLRAEDLAPILQPEKIVIAFIPADAARCEMAVYCAYKPYFELDETGLVLHDDHLPAELPAHPWWIRALGHSALADTVFRRAAPQWWLAGYTPIQAHRRGREVACALLDRLSIWCRARDIELLAVALPEGTEVMDHNDQARYLAPVINCATAHGVTVLDLLHAYTDALQRNPTAAATLFNPEGMHMSASGNEWVAGHIAAAISTHRPALSAADAQPDQSTETRPAR